MKDTLQGTCTLKVNVTISLETSAGTHIETQSTSQNSRIHYWTIKIKINVITLLSKAQNS